MNAADRAPILAEFVDATSTGRLLSAAPLPTSALGAERRSVPAGDLSLALIRASALARHHVWRRDFSAAIGALPAPHGKTTRTFF